MMKYMSAHVYDMSNNWIGEVIDMNGGYYIVEGENQQWKFIQYGDELYQWIVF